MTNTQIRREFLRQMGIGTAAFAFMPHTVLAQDKVNKTFEVGKGWYDTGIDVKVGDDVTFNAFGIVDIGGSGEKSLPHGGTRPLKVDADHPLDTAGKYGLIGHIGNSYFPVGDKSEMNATYAGRLFLSVNDHMQWDNTGSYNVTVKVNDKEHKKTVPGHGGFWTDTGIDVKAGKEYVITASGNIDIGGASGETSTPGGKMPNGKSWGKPPEVKGDQKNADFPLKTAEKYSLIGCIDDVSKDYTQFGDKTTYFAVGDRMVLKPTTSGRLRFGCNDHKPWDNSKSYKVTVVEQ